MEWTPQNYSPPYFRRILPEDNKLRFRAETEDSVLQKVLCGSIATGHHGYMISIILRKQLLTIFYTRVSLKVAAFHEPDETQGPNKRPRTKAESLDEDIEPPSLNGNIMSEAGAHTDNLFSLLPNSQTTSPLPHAKDSTPKNNSQLTGVVPLMPKLQIDKERSAREQVEASKLRQMVRESNMHMVHMTY